MCFTEKGKYLIVFFIFFSSIQLNPENVCRVSSTNKTYVYTHKYLYFKMRVAGLLHHFVIYDISPNILMSIEVLKISVFNCIYYYIGEYPAALFVWNVWRFCLSHKASFKLKEGVELFNVVRVSILKLNICF